MLLFSGALLPPLLVSLIYHDGDASFFGFSILLSVAIGLITLFSTYKCKLQLTKRDGFIIVVALWFATSLLGALIFVLALNLPAADAFFESVSAFTTTGATVITGLDQLPKSILFFRQEMQWLGGIGVVVSAVALLPMLGVGGMQMFKAETPGPMKDEKLTPRISHTAQILWRLYLVMTIVCAFFYWEGGMPPFDAIAHSLSTVSTGGFSTHDSSLAYYDSVFIENVAIVFMLLGGINFSVHFMAWRNLSIKHYTHNLEAKTFLIVILIAVLITTLVLYIYGEHNNFEEALRYAGFTVVSVVTSTGYGIDDFSQWPLLLPLLLMFLSFVGGCAGSTAGGMKVIRFLIMGKGVILEMKRLIHPNMVKSLQLERKTLSPVVADSVRSFFSVYVALFAVFMLLLMSQGIDQVTAFSAVATCINNLGPGLHDVAANFQSVPDPAKWELSFAMLLGRLEIFTMLVLLSPQYWKK